MLPQMLIYKGKSIQRDWVKDIDEDEAIFAVSDKGYMTDELTGDRASGEPRLPLLDGHRIHYSLPFVRYAVQNNILLFSYITPFPSSATLSKTISITSILLSPLRPLRCLKQYPSLLLSSYVSHSQ